MIGALAALTAVGDGSPLERIGNQPGAGVVLIVLALCCARLAVLTLDLQETSS